MKEPWSLTLDFLHPLAESVSEIQRRFVSCNHRANRIELFAKLQKFDFRENCILLENFLEPSFVDSVKSMQTEALETWEHLEVDTCQKYPTNVDEKQSSVQAARNSNDEEFLPRIARLGKMLEQFVNRLDAAGELLRQRWLSDDRLRDSFNLLEGKELALVQMLAANGPDSEVSSRVLESSLYKTPCTPDALKKVAERANLKLERAKCLVCIKANRKNIKSNVGKTYSLKFKARRK